MKPDAHQRRDDDDDDDVLTGKAAASVSVRNVRFVGVRPVFN